MASLSIRLYPARGEMALSGMIPGMLKKGHFCKILSIRGYKMGKWTSIFLLVLFPAAICVAGSGDDRPGSNGGAIYDSQGNYHGRLSDNPHNPDSTSNPHSRYGSPHSSESINNPHGIGSPHNVDSPNNPHGGGLRIESDQ